MFAAWRVLDGGVRSDDNTHVKAPHYSVNLITPSTPHTPNPANQPPHRHPPQTPCRTRRPHRRVRRPAHCPPTRRWRGPRERGTASRRSPTGWRRPRWPGAARPKSLRAPFPRGTRAPRTRRPRPAARNAAAARRTFLPPRRTPLAPGSPAARRRVKIVSLCCNGTSQPSTAGKANPESFIPDTIPNLVSNPTQFINPGAPAR